MAQNYVNPNMAQALQNQIKKQQTLILQTSKIQGAYCYSLKKKQKQIFNIDSSYRIFRNNKNGDIKPISLSDAKKGKLPIINYSHLLSIDLKFSKEKGIDYLLHKPKQTYPYDNYFDVFVSLRNFNTNYNKNGCRLREGDHFKIAYMVFRVLFIKSQGQPIKYCENSNSFQYQNVNIGGQCRICLNSQSEDADDFIITPCQCKGSCETVHYQCLKKWVENKVIITKRRKIVQYDFSNFKCQICKSNLARCIIRSIQNKPVLYYLFDFKYPYSARRFVIERNNKWYSFTFQEYHAAIIGRQMTNSDLYLADNHVSNMHCCIQNKDKNFYLSDLGSTYGTYILLDRDFVINKEVGLMIGNDFLEFAENSN